ncbi:TetR family transcriptional regulator [candidate division KSB1 bacterium]|nr:TetR family transcriptional regulator [candidate division KSB1 bacterium]
MNSTNGINDKRQRILKAAARVFSRKGFYKSTVAEIAKEAQVADGTIYLYFKNKDDILITLFEDEMATVIREMKQELSGLDTAEQKIRKFIEKHLALIDENRELAEVIQIELRQSHKFMKEYSGTKFRDYVNIISSIINEGQKNGEFNQDIIPGIAKIVLFGSLDELSNYWVLSKRKKYSLSLCAQITGDIFLSGIK